MIPGKKKNSQQSEVFATNNEIYIYHFISYVKKPSEDFLETNNVVRHHGMASPCNWGMAGGKTMPLKTTSGVDTSTDRIQNMIDTWLFDCKGQMKEWLRTNTCWSCSASNSGIFGCAPR